MQFQLLPVLDIMLDFYTKPRTIERFQDYLQLLQGSSKDKLVLPIAGFNPMAKEHVLLKLQELQACNVEQIMQETIADWNAKQTTSTETNLFQVAFNLADDLHGGWTNRFTTDYDHAFNFSGLFNKKFCTPIFWTSEEFFPHLIRERTLTSLFRTQYFLNKSQPKTLHDHVEQERYVAQHVSSEYSNPLTDLDKWHTHFLTHEHSEEYAVIFNFFYGDDACKILEFPQFGVSEAMAGFRYCQAIK
ncbi:MAG: hypothetical protein ACRCYO_17705 [Bacteroidia bacterium]